MPTQVKQTGTWIWAFEIATYMRQAVSPCSLQEPASCRYYIDLYFSTRTPLPLGLFDANVLLYFFCISMPSYIEACIFIFPKKMQGKQYQTMNLKTFL